MVHPAARKRNTDAATHPRKIERRSNDQVNILLIGRLINQFLNSNNFNCFELQNLILNLAESGEVASKDIKKSNDRIENGTNNNNNSDDAQPSPHPDGSSGADRGSGSVNNDQPGTIDTPTNNTNTTQATAISPATSTGPSTSPKPLRLSDKFKALFKVCILRYNIYNNSHKYTYPLFHTH